MQNRLKTFWREKVRRWWYDFEWPVIGALGLAVLVLGCVGFRLQLLKEGKATDLFDLIFRTCQLFVLQISVEPPMPWQLNAARLLAPLIAAYTALQALAEIFAGQMHSLYLRFQRGHVVICGLGRKGLILARYFVERGQTVVVIEQDAENDLVGQCRDLGAIVLIGDAAEPWLLRRAGVERAMHLFALCGDDGVNAEVAVRAAQLVAGREGPPLTCVLHIYDPQLCALLRERELDASSAGRLRLEFCNNFDLGARVLLEEHPLCPLAGGGPHGGGAHGPGRRAGAALGGDGHPDQPLQAPARLWPAGPHLPSRPGVARHAGTAGAGLSRRIPPPATRRRGQARAQLLDGALGCFAGAPPGIQPPAGRRHRRQASNSALQSRPVAGLAPAQIGSLKLRPGFDTFFAHYTFPRARQKTRRSARAKSKRE